MYLTNKTRIRAIIAVLLSSCQIYSQQRLELDVSGDPIASTQARNNQTQTHPNQIPLLNGKDLTGWKGAAGYWSFKNGAIVGHADENVPRNEFIWSNVIVKDFYLSVDVQLTPDSRNAGIQFRSKPVNQSGQALGYQADIGKGVWGKLYHEHGRGKLDWNDRAATIVKRGEWNRYEILASGHRIWTAINGTVCVAVEDAQGELQGRLAFQIHSGEPQTVRYRKPILTHDPKIQLAGQNEKQLMAMLTKL